MEIAVLTNGLVWWFYLPLLTGSWEQRKFFTIDIRQQEIQAAVQRFEDFLKRDAVASGEAAKRARAMHAGKEKVRLVAESIPKAWNHLCHEPDEKLLELFAEKVESFCGHKPDLQRLAEFLAKETRIENGVRPITPPPPARPPSGKTRQASNLRFGRIFTGTKPVAFTFLGTRTRVSTFKDVLIGLAQALHKKRETDFNRVLSLRGTKRAYFARDLKGMTQPQEILGSGIFAETNLSANDIIKQCHALLKLFGYSESDLQVEVEQR